MHPLIETHRVELLALASRRGVTGVRIFGSMSRGDGSESTAHSDVDLLVTLTSGTSALVLGGCCWMRRNCWAAVRMLSPKRVCTPRCARA